MFILSTAVGIRLSEVITEIGNSDTKLSECFTNATGTFNPTYEGSKDRLSNFRGYDHAGAATYTVYWTHNQYTSGAGSYFTMYNNADGSYLYGIDSDYGQFDVDEGETVDMYINEYNVSPDLHVYAVSQDTGYITGNSCGSCSYVYDSFTMPDSNCDVYGVVYN